MGKFQKRLEQSELVNDNAIKEAKEEAKVAELGKKIMMGVDNKLTVDFDFSHIDPSFKGKFVFHYPSVIDHMKIGVLRAQLLNGLQEVVDPVTFNIAHYSATLGVVLDECPDWFDPQKITELEILKEVYDKFDNWASSFRERMLGKNGKDS